MEEGLWVVIGVRRDDEDNERGEEDRGYAVIGMIEGEGAAGVESRRLGG